MCVLGTASVPPSTWDTLATSKQLAMRPVVI
jgi:hypothetical protein